MENKKASTIKAGRSCFVPDGKGRKMGSRKEENKADCKENREENRGVNRGVNRKPGEKEVMICMNNINKGYMLGEEKVPVLRDVCFRVEKGEFVAILGPSGSGKTTLMNIIGCMDIADSGEYFLDGNAIHEMTEKELNDVRNKEIGFIFQNYQLIPTYNILQNIIMPLVVRGMGSKEAEEKCMDTIRLLGIDHRLRHKPSELSGGQKQRVSIARALVGEPASGSVDHFGSASGFSLPNSGIQIGVSSKYIDLGTLLDADAGRGVESLEPDIAVPQTMADTLAGRDTAVEWLLAHPETLEQREYPDAPLTRGRFVGQLYAAAGSPAAAAEAGFQDLLGIEWFLPAVNWAAETGVTGGTAEGAFAAARHLTWQEAAVFLVRTAEALGLEPEAVRTAPLPDALAEGAWDQTALELAWEWGLLPEDAGSAAEIARVQGGAMADTFAALL